MKTNIKYFTALVLVSGFFSAQNIDINAMPKPGPTPTINITQPKSFTLPNGLSVMVVENHKLPRVNMSLSIDRPPLFEGDIAGVSSIMADQLGNGTTSMSKADFNEKIDYLGANLNFFSTGASANTLSKYFLQVMDLISDAIVNPKFSQEEVQKSKDQELEGLKASEKSAEAIASKVFSALTYGKNTARGEFDTPESISKISLADVQNNYNKYYAPDHAYLIIIGDVNFDEVKKLVTSKFSNWKKSNTTFAALTPAQNVAATEINVVDVPNAVQSVINIGDVTDLKMNDPKYFAAMLANYILGGGGDSRLFMNLREKNGFTYGAYSTLTTEKYGPKFKASSSVRNEVTDKAIVEFMKELNAISTVSADELQNAKEKLKGNFILSLERPETIARFALNQKTQNLSADFYTNYLKSIDKVTPTDISTAVKAFIFPNKSRIFVAGKAADISAGLEKLGYPVKYYDKNANPTEKKATQAVSTDVNIEKIANNYINAIGGMSAVSKITSITTDATATVQNMPLKLHTIVTSTGKKLIDISMMGNSVQKIMFDGTKGYMVTQGNKTDLPQEMITLYTSNKQIFPEVNYATDKDITLAGIENYNEDKCYVVKGKDFTAYYSVKTGLKVGEVRVQKMKGQTMEISTNYNNYQTVEGVKLPYTISQNAMGQDLNFKVDAYTINKSTDADFN